MSIVAWADQFDVRERAVGAALLFTGVFSLLADSTLIPVPALAALASRTPLAAATLAAPGPVPKLSTPLSAAAIKYVAFGPSASPAQIAFYERMLIACPPDVRTGVALRLADLDLRQALTRLNVPTLVMAGENDRLTPPCMRSGWLPLSRRWSRSSCSPRPDTWARSSAPTRSVARWWHSPPRSQRRPSPASRPESQQTHPSLEIAAHWARVSQ